MAECFDVLHLSFCNEVKHEVSSVNLQLDSKSVQWWCSFGHWKDAAGGDIDRCAVTIRLFDDDGEAW